MIRKASFEEKDISRMILGFKNGRNIYTRWAVRQCYDALMANDLSNVVIMCVPASTPCSHARRWKCFSSMLCSLTGAIDGYPMVTVSGSRKRAHVTREYELATNIKHFVHFDEHSLRGSKVLLIDDIVTTGQSAQAFAGALEAHGAHVIGQLFLAKTRKFSAC